MLNEEQLFFRFKGKAVLLDSNLLLVFLTGSLGAQVFKRFKRISDYTLADYELLVRFIDNFSVLLTTPHILTEISNLANSLPNWYKPDWYENLAGLIACNGDAVQVREEWVPAIELVKMPEFISYGITDSVVTKLSSEALVLTEDYRLSGALRHKNVPVMNFRDLKSLQMLN
jgi:hypothetical protein